MTGLDPVCPPRLPARILGWLLPGAIGAEVLQALDLAYRKRRVVSGRLRADVWYAAHLLHPHTWLLASRLFARRRGRPGGVRPSGWWLELRLAVRMTARHPGLAVVPGLSVAVAVAVAAGFFAYTQNIVDPDLPLEEGERIVALQNQDLESGSTDTRFGRDFTAWRESLTSVTELGAFRMADVVLGGEGDGQHVVRAAYMSASGFDVARVAPLLGRRLLPEDEVSGASPVVVLSEALWSTVFTSDRSVRGRDVVLGGVPHTVVGVMPADFGFPLGQEVWLPLPRASGEGRGDFPVVVFGRLSEAVDIESARAELTLVGERAAASDPGVFGRLRPRLVAFPRAIVDPPRGLVAMVRLIFAVFVLLVCANVGALVFARVLARRGELALRASLGATRARLVGQLSTEVLLVCALGASAGLALAAVILERASGFLSGRIFLGSGAPFWWRTDLGFETVVFAAVLTLIAAVVAGLLPALIATRPGLRGSLQRHASQAGSTRMGRGAHVAIAGQVSLSVLLLTLVFAHWSDMVRNESEPPWLGERTYVTASLRLPEGASGPLNTLTARVSDAPGVRGVTFASTLPGLEGGVVEVEVDGSAPRRVRVWGPHVDAAFFDVFALQILAGRGLRPEDLDPDGSPRSVMIVSRAFARTNLQGRRPLEARVRVVTAGVPGPWLQVVGVVEDLDGSIPDEEAASVYLPLESTRSRVTMAVRTVADAAEIVAVVRQAVNDSEPEVGATRIAPLAARVVAGRRVNRVVYLAMLLAAGTVLALCMSGLHALMAFFVSERAREIGIRKALGAGQGQVVRDLLGRALHQLGAGALLGILLSLPASALVLEGGSPIGSLVVALFMVATGVLACARPVKTLVEIHPTDAMRADA